MSAVERLVRWYGWLVRLYPRPFRELFAEELCSVFAQSLQEAEQQGQWGVLKRFLRELLDFLPNLLREYITDRRFYQMTERFLTHRQHSRWRQAGALGFAVGFGAMELINRVIPLPDTKIGLPVFPGSLVQISILNQPNGQYAITPFHGLGVLLLMVCGLAAGGILSRAEETASKKDIIPWGKSLGIVLLTALSMPGAYLLLYGFEYLLWGMQNIIPVILYVPLNLLNAFLLLYGGLAAILLGMFLDRLRNQPQQERKGKRIFAMGVAGMTGMMAGELVGFLCMVVVGILNWGLRSFQQLVDHLPELPQVSILEQSTILGVGAMVILSAIQGWYFGAWVGNELGKGQEIQTVALEHKPLKLTLIVLLSCVALVVLFLLLTVSVRSG